MNKKLRIIIFLCSLAMIAIYIIELLLCKSNFIGKIALCICYAMNGIWLIYNLLIALKSIIKNKKCYNKGYKVFEIWFDYLKNIHRERYKLYFSDDKKKIEIYSAIIECIGDYLLYLGKLLTSEKVLNKKRRIKLEEMMKKTERMMKEVKA